LDFVGPFQVKFISETVKDKGNNTRSSQFDKFKGKKTPSKLDKK
jgi:hypothetical protein